MRRPLDGVCVLFDLDGTLIDTAEDLAASMNHALAAAGRAQAPLARVRGLIGGGARAMLRRGLEEVGAPPPGEAELDALVDSFIDYYRDHIAERSRPFPGVIETIETIRTEGALVAICTNKRESLARALVEALGLQPLFCAIVGGDTVGVAKPDPRPALACLEMAKAEAGVFIGDSDTDIRAAAAARLPCLVATFGYGPLDLADTAFAPFSDYQEAPALIRRAADAGRPRRLAP